jgi:glucosamine 6-phosphate synthetase-like amidotransferase/phosphosugar isomerase protein
MVRFLGKSHFITSVQQQPALLRDGRELWAEELNSFLKNFRPFTSINRQNTTSALSFHFIGTGSSYHSALWAHCLWSTYGIPSRTSQALDVVTGKSPLHPDEAVIAISHRGARGLTKKLLTTIKPHIKHRPLLLCADGAKAMYAQALHTSAAEQSMAHSISLFGAISALSLLLQKLLPAKRAESLNRQRKHCAKVLDQSLNAKLIRSKTDLLFKSKRPWHFVGSGANYAVALEAALKTNEIGRHLAIAHHTEALLHGPLVGFQPGDVVIAIRGTNSIENNRFSRMAQALSTLKCHYIEAHQLITVKKAAKKAAAPQHHTYEPWLALEQLLIIQRLLNQWALDRGLNPDTNNTEISSYKRAAELCAFV